MRGTSVVSSLTIGMGVADRVSNKKMWKSINIYLVLGDFVD